jgi:broad specificity phosphatase PhoE
MAERVAHLVKALAKQGERSVVLVAHGEVIGSYLGHLRGTPAPKRYPPGIANASISVVDALATAEPRLLLANMATAAP